jgi:hypothetical protein
LWKARLPLDHQVGPGSSPVLYKNLLILVRDGRDAQYVTALDKQTGKEVWKTDRPPIVAASGNLKKSFVTPLLVNAAGRIQLISPTAHWIVSYDPSTGKEIWRARHGKGFSIGSCPVFGDGKAFFSTGCMKPELWAVRADGEGDVTATHAVWKSTRQVPVMSSPVLLGDELFWISDDGMAITNSELMRRALEYSKMFEKPILAHCEDTTLTRGFVMNEGRVSAKLGLRGYPNAAEAVMAARDCYLAALTGGHVHICHVSAKETVDVVRRAKKQGIRVTAEAAPHHLMLTDEALVNYESKYKMNPPLRSREDVDAVLEGVVDGTIDAIASDHAPHTAEEKEQELAACPNGIIGLETTLGVVLSLKKIPFDRAIDAMTAAPARILGLAGKGVLKAGADADLTLIAQRLAAAIRAAIQST